MLCGVTGGVLHKMANILLKVENSLKLRVDTSPCDGKGHHYGE
jgi:hypothetical protein